MKQSEIVRLPSATVRRAALASTTLVLLVSALAGCKEESHTGEEHSAVPGGTAAHPDHHDPGEAEKAHSGEVTLSAEAIERYGITIETAQRRQLRPTLTSPGRVAFNSEAMAHVGSPLRGRAAEIKVGLGSIVTAGDDLIVVESPEFAEAQGDFLLKRTTAQTMQPQIDLAKTAWDRARGLYEKSEGIALTEVQKREGEYKAAVAAQRGADSSAAAAENRLHLFGMEQPEVDALAASGQVNPRFAIRAPIGGQVVVREVTLGELVSPDRDSLLVIADTSVLWVLADVPEGRVHDLTVGAAAWVKVGSVDAPRYEGAIAFISPMVDAATRTAEVRIEVRSSDHGGPALRPGMFALTEIVTAAAQDAPAGPHAIAVPEQAVQTVEGGPALFVPVPGEENTFALRPVTAGTAVGGFVPIHSGLAEAERFVAGGSFILKAQLGKADAGHGH